MTRRRTLVQLLFAFAWLTILIILPGRVNAQTGQATAFYVTAHEDDWQLFHGEQAYKDLQEPSDRIVFITATAGDDGRGEDWWSSREQGEVDSIAAGLGWWDPQDGLVRGEIDADTADVDGHSIQRYTFVDDDGTTRSVLYSLRLPDGEPDGSGSDAQGHQSLSHLRDNGTPVSAVDGSTEYDSWADFVGTLQDIMASEWSVTGAPEHPWVNANRYIRDDTPDHADHLAVADALRAFVAGQYNRAWWQSYGTRDRDANLGDTDISEKGALIDAYDNGVVDSMDSFGSSADDQQSGWADEWNWWGSRSYSNTQDWDQPDP